MPDLEELKMELEPESSIVIKCAQEGDQMHSSLVVNNMSMDAAIDACAVCLASLYKTMSEDPEQDLDVNDPAICWALLSHFSLSVLTYLHPGNLYESNQHMFDA